MWYPISVVIFGFLIFKFFSLYNEKISYVDSESQIILTVIGSVFWPVCIALILMYLLYKLLLDKIYTKFIIWLLNEYFKK